MNEKCFTLYCLSCAGASAASFLRWRRHAPSWLDVKPVERPGRGGRANEPHCRDFARLVEALTDEVTVALPQRYAFFGHSLGALLAFGCAHELRRRGYPPARALLLACSAAPSRRDDERLARLTTDQQLIDELKQLNGTPMEVFSNAELKRLTLDAASADFALCASYRHTPRTPLEIPFFVFGGRADIIDREALEAWSAEGSQSFMCELFDGGHFFFRDQERQFVALLAQKVRPLSLELSF